MSEFAKSLRRANRLNDFDEGLRKLGAVLEENRRRKEQQELINTVIDLYDKWKANQEATEKQNIELKEGGKVFNPFTPQKPIGLGSTTPAGMNLLDITPEGQEKPIRDKLPFNITPETTIPETQTRIIPKSEKYQKSQTNYSEFMNAVAPLLVQKQATPNVIERVNILTTLAKEKADKLKPKEPMYFDLSEGQQKYLFDPETGEKKLIATNPKQDKANIEEYERDEQGNYKIYTIEGQKFYNKIKKDSQGRKIGEELTRIPKKGEGGTTINLPETPPDISQQEKDLTKAWDNYDYYNKKSKEIANEIAKAQEEYNKLLKSGNNDEARKTRATIDELKTEYETIDEQKNIWFTDVKAVTNQTANKLNSQMPGFEKIYNLLFQSPEVKSKDSDKIDELVEREMEGASDDAKRWMKRLLKVRAF